MDESRKQQSGTRRSGRMIIRIGIVLLMWCSTGHSLTRWSTVQLVPHADMLAGGTFVLAAQGYFFSDVIDGTTIRPAGLVDFGIIEWINIEAGYTGGFNLGLKARILGETKPWMPSFALGVRNIFSHREAYLFGRTPDTLGNEIYCVFGKSVEAARLRFHAGIQSIPGNQHEQFNPFAAIEKYFGMGLYVTAEVHRRDRIVHPSLFAQWRFWKRRLEVAAGVVDIAGMFIHDDVPPNSPFFRSGDAHFVRPGVWAGLRFRGGVKIGKMDGLAGLENRLYDNSTSIEALRGEVDSLKSLLQGSSSRIENMDRSIARMNDSSLTDEERLKALAVDRLAVLKGLYEDEPFEPDAVNKAMNQLVANRDRMLPALYEIITDPVRENKIRTLAITALGEINTQAAADVIIEVLGQSPNPEMTIECLIALGKMKETRAVYLMQQLSNDPNDDIAFTAAEVLQKIEKETGITVTPVPVARIVPESIPEKKIGSGETYEPDRKPEAGPVPASKKTGLKKTEPKTVAPQTDNNSLHKIEKPEFMEATVAAEAEGKEDIKPVLKAEAKNAEKAPGSKSEEKDAGKTPVPAGSSPEPVFPAPGAKKVAPGVSAEKTVMNEEKTMVPIPEPSPKSDKSSDLGPPVTEKKPVKKGEKERPSSKRIDLEKETW